VKDFPRGNEGWPLEEAPEPKPGSASSTLAHLAPIMPVDSAITGDLLLQWKALSLLKETPLIDGNNVLFKVQGNPGVFTQFGVSPDRSYIPLLFKPNIAYHHAIRTLLKRRFGSTLDQLQYPYRIFVPRLNAEVSFALQIRLYLPNILVMTAKLSKIPVQLSTESLIRIQDLQDLPPISDIIRWTIGMVETFGHQSGFSPNGFRAKPLMYVRTSLSSSQFETEIAEHTAEYVGIVIRNLQYRRMNAAITQKVIEKSSPLRVKSSDELLLVDKQGIFDISADSGGFPDQHLRRRLSRLHDLMEVSLVFTSFLDNFRSLRARQEDLADFLISRISPWITNSDAVLGESVTNRLAWHLLLDEFGLRAKLTAATEGLSVALDEKRPYFDQVDDGWWETTELTSILSKQLAALKGLQLGFIDDQELRALVIADYEEARRSLAARNYKSVILLCGSIIEALLTDTLAKVNIPGLTRSKLLKHDLADLIHEAEQQNVINDKMLIMHLQPIRHYRNMIHPGVQVRKSIEPDRSRAQIAMETVNLLIRELKRNAGK
jgi:hypothetical protein